MINLSDFNIDFVNNNLINLVGIESPGLTSSLSIAREIKEKIKLVFSIQISFIEILYIKLQINYGKNR